MSVHSMGKMGNDVFPNFLTTLLENFDGRSCNSASYIGIPCGSGRLKKSSVLHPRDP